MKIDPTVADVDDMHRPPHFHTDVTASAMPQLNDSRGNLVPLTPLARS